MNLIVPVVNTLQLWLIYKLFAKTDLDAKFCVYNSGNFAQAQGVISATSKMDLRRYLRKAGCLSIPKGVEMAQRKTVAALGTLVGLEMVAYRCCW